MSGPPATSCESARSPSSTGTTPRTIRYYEEIGLLPAAGDREPGAHRTYAKDDVERLTELLRLKDLLGRLARGAEGAGQRRGRPRRPAPRVARRRRGPGPAPGDPRGELGHIARQLELVRRRRDEIAKLEEELLAKRKRVRDLLRELTAS